MVPAGPEKKPLLPVVDARLGRLLGLVLLLFALLVVNSVYLLAITVLEQTSDQIHQDYFYLLMFLLHLALGLLLIVPVVLFGVVNSARPARTLSSTAWRLSTGKAPGCPVHTGHTWLLGAAPYAAGQLQKSLLRVFNSTCASKQMMVSKSDKVMVCWSVWSVWSV